MNTVNGLRNSAEQKKCFFLRFFIKNLSRTTMLYKISKIEM